VQRRQDFDPHLRSLRNVTGYHIAPTDDSICHVEDFLYDEETWSLRYLLIDTRNWLPGKKVLVAPAWTSGIDWAGKKLQVDADRETIKQAPEYDPDKGIDPALEQRIFKHYGRAA
jgi:hypothetical protein